jgi:hypothetical protein
MPSPTTVTTATAPPTDPAAGPPGLVVALRRPADLTTTLEQAAARARAQRRPLIVLIVGSARPWTIDAAVVAVQDRRHARETASMASAAEAMCARAAVEVREVVVVPPPWAWTRRGRDRALHCRLAALAESRNAELHPVPSAGSTAPDHPAPNHPVAGQIVAVTR